MPVVSESATLQTFDAIRAAWNAETAYKPKEWASYNPAWGQCASTALVIKELYGGYVMRSLATLPDGEKYPHFFNVLPEATKVSLTWDQFPDGTTFETARRATPSGVSVKRRARILMTRLHNEMP